MDLLHDDDHLLLQTKSKIVVQSTFLTPRPNRFTGALPPRGSRDPLRLAESGALPMNALGTAREVMDLVNDDDHLLFEVDLDVVEDRVAAVKEVSG